MLMKKLFFLFMMLAMGMYAQAQQLDVCTKPYGDDGSEITVISEVGKGSTFTVILHEEKGGSSHEQ